MCIWFFGGYLYFFPNTVKRQYSIPRNSVHLVKHGHKAESSLRSQESALETIEKKILQDTFSSHESPKKVEFRDNAAPPHPPRSERCLSAHPC